MTPANHEPWRARRGRVRAWSVLLGAWLATAVGSSCTLTLDEGIGCGDGYWDEELEECDVAVPETYVDACPAVNGSRGTAACHPTKCIIIATPDQCAVCGDGVVDDELEDEDREEECDGDNLNGFVCPGGVGTLQCASCRFDTTYCQSCGNTILDPGEECDPSQDPTDLTQGKPPCEELSPYYADKPYTSGEPGSCRDDCRWDRSTCGYCNNGELEGEDNQALVDEGIPAPPEQCDGDEFDPMALDTTLASSVCTIVDGDLWPTTRTCEDCVEISYVENPGEPCCVKPGGACPEEGGPLRCCSEIGETPASERCQNVYTGGMWFEACSSHTG